MDTLPSLEVLLRTRKEKKQPESENRTLENEKVSRKECACCGILLHLNHVRKSDPGMLPFRLPSFLLPIMCRKHNLVCDWLATLQNKVLLIQSHDDEQELLQSSPANGACNKSALGTICACIVFNGNGHADLQGQALAACSCRAVATDHASLSGIGPRRKVPNDSGADR